MDDETCHEVIKRQEALEAELDVFLLQRAQEIASGYLPFEALLRQHRDLFGKDLQLPDLGRPRDEG